MRNLRGETKHFKTMRCPQGSQRESSKKEILIKLLVLQIDDFLFSGNPYHYPPNHQFEKTLKAKHNRKQKVWVPHLGQSPQNGNFSIAKLKSAVEF